MPSEVAERAYWIICSKANEANAYPTAISHYKKIKKIFRFTNVV